MAISYITIFERTHPEQIIFTSSNCEQAIGYTPQEMLGTSAMKYSADLHAEHYTCQWPSDNPELGLTMMPHNLRCKDGRVVFTHVISINCSGYMFSVVNAYPELGRVDLGESVLYKLEHQVNFDALDTSKPTPGTRSVAMPENADIGNTQSGSQLASDAESMVHLNFPKVTEESLKRSHVYTARASRVKACVILSKPADEGGGQGPVIEFVTNTISSIYSGDVDADELIGTPFLSLVASEDITKAALYMDNLFRISKPQLCAIRLVRHPMPSDNEQHPEDTEPIEIEAFGASSNDKLMLLCQKVRRKPRSTIIPANADDQYDDDMPYMTLEEIISSDPESSDINEQWYEFPL